MAASLDDAEAGRLRERDAHRDAGAGEHGRDRILALVSHDLRSPLNGIQSWAHVLENRLVASGVDDALTAQALDGIRDGIAHQVRILDDLVDLSAAWSGVLALAETRLVVADLVVQSIDRLAAIARDRDVRVEAPPPGGEAVMGDERRLGRAFDHLITDAIRFAPAGTGVRISITREGARVVVRIRDDGDRDASVGGATSGAGIGVTLAHLLVEAHGGRLHVESAEVEGNTASIVLPAPPGDVALDNGTAAAQPR